MINTLKAFLKGFVYFTVNDHPFLTYGRANACVEAMRTLNGDILFLGFNIFTMRWECFYIKAVQPTTIHGLFKQVS